MRAVIQRVKNARVEIGGEVVGAIDQGLLVLLGITHEDGPADIEWLIKKMVNQRIFSDAEDKMNLSVQDVGGGILIVSQFTLFASVKKGNRPGYTRSAPPEIAIPIYKSFLERLGKEFSGPVQTGEFGAKMDVHLLNDGPVTIVMDTQQPDF